MQLNFMGILELIFPQGEDERAIAKCTNENFILKLAPSVTGDVVSISSFKDPSVRSAIHLNKFHAHPKAQALLSALLRQYLISLPQQEYLLIPIPLSSKRRRDRGYNQVEMVARYAIKELPHIIFKADVIKKIRNTPMQTSLTRQERLKNLTDAFKVLPLHKKTLAQKHILLLDDVYTTGATLHEAKKVLLPFCPASVTCVALAH